MKNVPGVYILEFPSGNYVGSSKHMRRRVLRHIADLKRDRHSNGFLQSVFKKYGAPTFRVLCECDEVDLLKFEQQFIDALTPRFNLSPTAGRNIGHRHSDETREAMRQASKDAWSRRSRSVSDEQRALISQTLKGRSVSDESREKIRAAKLGKKRPPEHGEAIRIAKAGRKINQRGHEMTSEIKAKISASLTAFYAGRSA